jgi:hypothetical protein
MAGGRPWPDARIMPAWEAGGESPLLCWIVIPNPFSNLNCVPIHALTGHLYLVHAMMTKAQVSVWSSDAAACAREDGGV